MTVSVYESMIEICLEPALERFHARRNKWERDLRALREKDLENNPDQDVLDHLWERACAPYRPHGSDGYVGFVNCAFTLLYGVFGIDIVAFLFGQDWVPAIKIKPFNAELFLERLSILEQASNNLADGQETPIRLEQTRPLFRPGMGAKLKCFNEAQHRLLLNFSLRELRQFGELALALDRANEDISVFAHIFISDGQLHPDILKFCARSTSPLQDTTGLTRKTPNG